jgi:hypothetical protein
VLGARDPAFVDQGDGGEVGEEGHREPRGPLEDRVDVERARHHLRGLGEEARAPLRLLGHRARRLLLHERHPFVRTFLELRVQAMQLDQRLHLAAQDVGHHRREDVVDGAERIAARGVHLVGEGGDEDDRRVRRLAARADELGGLQAVHARHVHVEQDHRALVVEEPAQRLLARGRGDDVLVELLEDGAEDHPLVEPVVDDEDVGSVRRAVTAGSSAGATAASVCAFAFTAFTSAMQPGLEHGQQLLSVDRF